MPRVVSVNVIITDECRGAGIEGDPIYRVYQMFTTDGQLICEAGPFFDEKQHTWASYDYLVGFDRVAHPVQELREY
jgi:hypothetical protein